MSEADYALAAFLASRHEPCPKCGYDRHKAELAACPECGVSIELHLVPAYRQVRPLYIMLALLGAAIATQGLVRVIELIRMWHVAFIGHAPQFTWYVWPAGLFDIAAALELISGVFAVAIVSRSLATKRPIRGLTSSVAALAIAGLTHAIASAAALIWLGTHYW